MNLELFLYAGDICTLGRRRKDTRDSLWDETSDERRDSMWGGRGTEGHSRDCDLDPFVSVMWDQCV